MPIKKTPTKKTSATRKTSTAKTKKVTMQAWWTLVIVESPTKARTISRFLGNDVTVVASMGHIVELIDKKMDLLVANNFVPQYEVAEGKNNVVRELKSLSKQANRIILATDEDREGEAIAWHLCQQLKIDPTTTDRIVFHEITESAILEALSSPRKVDMPLVQAQQARAVLDKLVWFTVSPVLRSKVKRGLSAGRVQSVAVKLVIEREQEIQAFQATEYRTAQCQTTLADNKSELTLSLRSISGIEESFQEHDTDEKQSKQSWSKFSPTLLSEALDRLWTVTSMQDESGIYKVISDPIDFTLDDITTKQSKKSPAAPFITSSLQQTGSRYFGWSVKQVMQVAQKLYENWFITYMRTDSTNLSKQALAQCKQYITKQFGATYHQARTYTKKSKNAQEAHEAIRPTNISLLPSQITLWANEQKLYQLIRNRMVASQMADAQFKLTSYLFHPLADERQTRVANGKIILFDGYMKLSWADADDVLLPTMQTKAVVTSKELLATQHFTKPPARYSEATLVKALESRGIGRPSTYASIITTIQDRGYVVKEDKSLAPTEVAFAVVAFLEQYFKNLMNYDFTASLEDRLDEIASGDVKRQVMLQDFWKTFEKELDASQWSERVRMGTGKTCPKCGAELLIKSGKNGSSFLGCEAYPDCDYVAETDAVSSKLADLRTAYEWLPCPEWGTIVVRMGRFGPFLSSSEYPAVKWIKSAKQYELDKQTATLDPRPCPTCTQGLLILKSSKRGVFRACNRYPDCDHAEKYQANGDTPVVRKKVVKRKVGKK